MYAFLADHHSEVFPDSMFAYSRHRLNRPRSPDRIADAVRHVVDATRTLTGRKRLALDSTLLDDAVATQNSATQLVSQIRRVLRLVPQAGMVDLTAHDNDASGKPMCAWDDPDAKAALVSGLVNDALAVLDVVADVQLNDATFVAVGLLALDTEPGHRWQRPHETPSMEPSPACERCTTSTHPTLSRERSPHAPKATSVSATTPQAASASSTPPTRHGSGSSTAADPTSG